MRKAFLVIALGISLRTVSGQTGPSPSYPLMMGRNGVQAKNYYLLTLFQEIPAVSKLLGADTTFVRLTKAKLQRISSSTADCQLAPFCYTDRLKFSDAEIQTVSNRLAALFTSTNALGKLVADHLIPSGTYIQYQNSPPKELLVKAWEQDAAGVNYAISVYGEGKKPHYPAIDSLSFRVSDKNYVQLTNGLSTTVYDECRQSTLFFSPSLTAALHLLELNEREQAADYEPMAKTVNRAAFDRIRTLSWKNFTYSVILVPGAGPDDRDVALSALGMLRCRVAALRYFEGLAPFLVVSGGRVHPYKTRFNEAIEMKRFLMETLRVPENAIIVEPHARHTTTNMRNTVRLIYRYGMPFDKPCLTSTSKAQSLAITTSLAKRCETELKHVPFRTGNRLSETEAEFYPVIDALQINPLEPLDP